MEARGYRAGLRSVQAREGASPVLLLSARPARAKSGVGPIQGYAPSCSAGAVPAASTPCRLGAAPPRVDPAHSARQGEPEAGRHTRGTDAEERGGANSARLALASDLRRSPQKT